MQVVHFANSLVDARNELQHKYVKIYYRGKIFSHVFACLKLEIKVLVSFLYFLILGLTPKLFMLYCSDSFKSSYFNRADVIQRKFVITKALLCKADRSSFDRLHQQIYKLELEQKRLEEDAFVYNSLQQQLKLSPAYQKMLELGACMEKEKASGLGENRDDDFSDISFEELLAQEKKDSFWQKNGKSRVCSS
ncbi:hypothetical protein VIGAN_07031900 [Vigna angularis var. angularis]|uniref:Uncharacterized protein n=1 Tax=Vigna angularis var. angularis TaxID=157739 RepID=A0A0S3SFU4_PHAAN|nr:hypothetical protein VIGAN_07031900 [Vigna angularis var. angularis]